MREVKGIRPRAIAGRRIGGQQHPEPRTGRTPLAHHPVRDHRSLDPGNLGGGARHQRRRDAHAKLARDHLIQQEDLSGRELLPPAEHRRALRVARELTEREDALFDPARQRQRRTRCLRLRQHERDRLRDVADRVVRLLEQPR
jgi:hypothetical protein